MVSKYEIEFKEREKIMHDRKSFNTRKSVKNKSK